MHPIFTIAGDSAYGRDMNLLKLYADRSENNTCIRSYNKILSVMKVLVEDASAKLKNKWQRLKKLNVMSMDRVRLTLRVCTIMHNLVQIHDPAAENYLEPAEPTERVLPVY